MKVNSFTLHAARERRSGKMLTLTPPPESISGLRKPNFERRVRPQGQRTASVYLFLTDGESLSMCAHCGSSNYRRRTIEDGHTISLENPDHPIARPRVSNDLWFFKIPLLGWFIKTYGYDVQTDWSLVKHATCCTANRASMGDCPNYNVWIDVQKRTCYRKFSRFRRLVIRIENLIWPKSFILKKVAPQATFM
ncbi:MAG: hypothetical protein QG640_245 [Patescibacteria group bacterium]|nr:hypothetical protein [Patescibacteria group bacterium]